MKEKGIRIIQQFLHENGLSSSLHALEAETKITFDNDGINSPNVLLSSIGRYEEALVERKKSEVEGVDDYLRARGDSKEPQVTQVASEIPLHVGNIIAVKFAPGMYVCVYVCMYDISLFTTSVNRQLCIWKSFVFNICIGWIVW
jgi:hypothetical protein